MSANENRTNPILWTLWQRYKQVSEGSLKGCIDKKYSALGEAVCEMLTADAARFSHFGGADEALYEHLTGLMGVYTRVLGLADEYSYDSPEVGGIVSGICDVLSARLREFDESVGEDKNPIATEKRVIMDEAVAKTAAAVDKQKLNFATGLREGVSVIWDESFEIILRGDFYGMYTNYRENLRSCITRLDDLQGRKIARVYAEMLRRGWEELSGIINIQAAALEEKLKNAPGSPVVISILDALREAGQQTRPVMENLQRLLQTPPGKSPQGRSFEEFEAGLIAASEAATLHPPERAEFFAALDAEAVPLFDAVAREYKKAAYNFQRAISAEVLLAEEVAGVFKRAFDSLPQFLGEEGIPEILRGIRETMEIKISGLNEAIQTFTRQSGETLKNFSAEKNNVPDGERQAVLDGIHAAWLEDPPEEDGLDEFLASCGEIFAPCRGRLEKQVHLYTEIFDKASIKFKKEVLLYEICTFEEILTHSASRLRESANMEVRAAAKKLEETFRSLEIILKKNNISVIRPAVREPFNPREHEVLVAEKQEGYEKGEIIKVVTTGYRYKGQVILRADVIAAR